MNQIIYQENLVANFISNEDLIKQDKFEKLIKDFKIKNNLSKIKQLNTNIKTIISSFIKEMDTITNEKLSDVTSAIEIKDFLSKLDLSNFKKIKNEFKFELIFNVLNNDNDKKVSEIVKKLKEINNNYEFIKAYHINSIQELIEFMESYSKDLESFIDPHIIKIYIIIIKKSQIKLLNQIFPNYGKEFNNYWPYNLRTFVYIKNEQNEIKFDSKISNFQNIFNQNFLSINKLIKDEINNLMKDIKYYNITDENENLNKTNLINKLKDEFIKFNGNKEIPFKDIIFKFNYSLNEEQKKKILFYFEAAFDLLNNRTDISNDNDNNNDKVNNNDKDKVNLLLNNFDYLLKRLNKLTENITCRKIYSFVYYKLTEFIIENNYNSTKTQFNDFISKLN